MRPRRRFLAQAAGLILSGTTGHTPAAGHKPMAKRLQDGTIRLFLCGDVMCGRGIDQILPHAGDPTLHEPYVASARDYVALAEKAHGPIPRPVAFAYVWGDALAAWARLAPDVRIFNLETAITASNDWQRDKGIHYRMHPANLPCLTAAAIDCCTLANNHVLDWGPAGLLDTLAALRRAGIRPAGAGRGGAEAAAPAILPLAGKGRVLVFAFGTPSSGILPHWGAGTGPGVNLLSELSAADLQRIARQVKALRQPGDVVVASIHWGGNWGYAIPREHVTFAHGLIDQAGVDVVHGHSSHHPLGIEVYQGRPILYGCGDLLNDYEGIGGSDAYRSDLSLSYFLDIEPASGRLRSLRMLPLQIRRMQLAAASSADRAFLRDTLNRESAKFGGGVELAADGSLLLTWTE